MNFGYKQIRADGWLSYLLWDSATRHAVAVDPFPAAQNDFRELLQELGLKLLAIVETQSRPAHLSCSPVLRQETGARIIMSRKTTHSQPDRLVVSGDRMALGALELEFLETPGHSPDGLSVLARHAPSNLQMAFTGQSLLIGSTGRMDSPDSDAGALFDSLRQLDHALLPDARIFPSQDSNDLLFSLAGVERRANAQFREEDRQTFIRLKQQESVASPSAAEPVGERVPAINVLKYLPKLEAHAKGEVFIDVRDPSEFRLGHMPGVENIPLSELAIEWTRLVGAKKVYLSCQSGRRSQMAARTLDRLGITGVVNVTGGFQAWSNAGFPVERNG